MLPEVQVSCTSRNWLERQVRPPLHGGWAQYRYCMTIDELAAVSQHEFESLHREMATKEELRGVGATLLKAIETIDLHLSSYALRWNDDFDRLHDRVHQIENRLTSLEKPT